MANNLCIKCDTSKAKYTCGHCYSCDGCRGCYNCGRTIHNKDNWCNGCDSCNQCCECYVGSGIKRFHNPLTFWKDDTKGRFIGAEMEIARSDVKFAKDVTDVLKKWKCSVVDDGSLPDTGYEIRLSPAMASLFEQEVKEVCSVLHKAKAKTTNACGLHIHIDAKDLMFRDLRNVVMLHELLEKRYLPNLVQSRFKNHFCSPVRSSYEYQSIKKSKGVRAAILNLRYGNRYHAVNLQAFFTHKTIEFRLPPGTVDPKKIIGWGKAYCALVDYAKDKNFAFMQNNDHKEIIDSFKKLTDN